MKKRFELVSRSEVLAPLRKELRELLAQAGWEKKIAEEILLAVDEALTNIIRHAYGGQAGTMTVIFSDGPEQTEITLEDRGKAFDPNQVPPPELPRSEPGGLGVHFIRAVMDRVVYDASFKDGNRLRLIKLKSKDPKGEGET
ncbi:MAG: ATP-binding protein [Candidatus Omnitrophica bacterium]|nr:ATP-binding protein [Candidatus Omnitrophota bacterium]